MRSVVREGMLPRGHVFSTGLRLRLDNLGGLGSLDDRLWYEQVEKDVVGCSEHIDVGHCAISYDELVIYRGGIYSTGIAGQVIKDTKPGPILGASYA
jgi:hypothetical protein